MSVFGIVDDATIKEGRCTDIYFLRTEEILRDEGRNPLVTLEVSTTSLPEGWAIFCGLGDLLALLEGLPLSVHAMPEGSLFYAREPVVRIQGRYLDLCRYETSILGFLCHASGVATATARVVQAAEPTPVYSFGSRRQHPAIASMIERSAWIGGVAGVSNVTAPAGVPVVGTMPHAFLICHNSVEEAFRAFVLRAPEDVPRILLCDTHCDEKREAVIAARVGAEAVRLDTPSSRRGDLRAILEEVRWELDAEGFEDVQIFLSGGLDLEDMARYRNLVDAFGVGGAIANARVVDFALDIVEIQGRNYAKRGKRSGVKQVYELPSGSHEVRLEGSLAPTAGIPLLYPWMEQGRILRRPDLQEARERAQKYRNRQTRPETRGLDNLD